MTLPSPPSTTSSTTATAEVEVSRDLGAAEDQKHSTSSHDESPGAAAHDALHPLAQLSSARKHALLAIFSIANFVDVCEFPWATPSEDS